MTPLHIAEWVFVSCLVTGIVVLGLLAFSALVFGNDDNMPTHHEDDPGE